MRPHTTADKHGWGRILRPGAAGLLILALATGAAAMGEGTLPRLSPIPTLLAQARARVNAEPYVELAPETTESLQGITVPGAPGAPSTLRALAAIPGSVRPFAHLLETVPFRGTVEPEVKLAMGLRLAQIDASPYVAIHLHRLLQATERGRALTRAIARGSDLAPRDEAALGYALTLGRGPRELGDAEFARVRGWYDDSQVVELTVTVAFYSYFTRLAEGLRLPVERWALTPVTGDLPRPVEIPTARVSLHSQEETEAYRALAERAAAAQRGGGLGLGIANSQRAMVRAPHHMRAWFDYWSAVRESQVVSRGDKLQVSFAVSMVNGCRYCTVHQVVGLRRAGIDPARLLALRRDDEALTPRERAAVLFARKLTRAPASVIREDYHALCEEFTAQGALEVVLQTCAFNFMNRFTDGLRLPSEDEAIHQYEEVYGPGSYAGYRGAQP